MRFTLSLMLVVVALPAMAEARTARVVKASRAARPVKHGSRLAGPVLPALALPASNGLAAFAMVNWAGGRAPATAPTVSPQ